MSNKQQGYVGTAHISAPKGAFPKTVLFPGDPLRAKWIAENFLEDAKLVTEVRNVLGYVGKYKGKEIGVMASGMGIPSAGIYSHELFSYYDVDNIIRIGTAGAYNPNLKVGTIVISEKAYSESTYAEMIGVETDEPKILHAKEELVKEVIKVAEEKGADYTRGLIHSADAFYTAKSPSYYTDLGMDAVEMEAFAIYANAKRLGKNGLTIATISDNIVTGENMPPIDRQTSLKEMVNIALEVGYRYNK